MSRVFIIADVLYVIALLIVYSKNYDFTRIIAPTIVHPTSIFDPSIILQSTSDCITCKYFNPQIKSDGSKFDFLCAVYFNKIVGLFPFVRTFRQYNKKSSIIIFIDEDGLSNMKELDKIALRHCGVTIINTGPIKSHLRALQIVRLVYFYDYLASCKLYFKRCIFTDGFDVFFQGDPFTTDLLERNLYLTIENETNNFLNKSYSQKFPDSYKIICSNNIINCGVFAGGTSIMFYFFSYFLKMFPEVSTILSKTTSYRNPYSDQDALNYFVYVHIKNMRFLRERIVLWNTSSNFASMIGEIRHKNVNVIWSFPHFAISSNIPLLVHQYTYSYIVLRSLYNVCGLLSHQTNVTDYYRFRTRTKKPNITTK